MKIVVIGGVAGGMSFAARARRLCEDCEIVVIERGPYVSFANCGLPYYLGGEISNRDDLLLHSPQTLRSSLDLDVRVNSSVEEIDRHAKRVSVRELSTGRTYNETYDKLVISTGASAFVPPIDGIDSDRVYTLRSMPDVDAMASRVDELQRTQSRAVVLGAGLIGLETVEALRRRDVDVTVVELDNQVLPTFDVEMASAIQGELVNRGVDVRLDNSIKSIRDHDDGLTLTLNNGELLEAGMVVIAVGVRTENVLAKAAGLEIDERGGLKTNEFLVTSDDDIYAVGDVIEVVDAVTGMATLTPLAGPANRQGRAAANHLFGRSGGRAPVLGTAIVRVFDLIAASTGQSEKSLRRMGTKAHVIHLHPNDHASYFPGAQQMHMKVMFDDDGRILGAQITGRAGVDKRIDVIATAIRAGMRVGDLADLELAYSPPFGSAKDPVNMAGFMGENVLSGDLKLWYANELSAADQTYLLDVRSREEYAHGHLRGARNIPHDELRQHIDEVPRGLPIRVYCAGGLRSYLASRVLGQCGWDDVRTLDGGLSTLLAASPDVQLDEEPEGNVDR